MRSRARGWGAERQLDAARTKNGEDRLAGGERRRRIADWRGSGNGAHIDDEAHLGRSKELHKSLDRARGMPDGEERNRADLLGLLQFALKAS